MLTFLQLQIVKSYSMMLRKETAHPISLSHNYISITLQMY